MPSHPIRRLGGLLTLAAALAPSLVAAQTPPIKTGLWEVHTDGGDAKEQKRAEQMKSLPPEVRKKMDAMLKERGVSVGGDGKTRVCLAKESLDSGAWAQREGCSTAFSERSSSRWKWHTSCPDAQVDGVATFASAESYKVDVTTTNLRGSHERTITAKWVGGDCAGLKPLAAQPLAASQPRPKR